MEDGHGGVTRGQDQYPEGLYSSHELDSTLDRLQEATHYTAWILDLISPFVDGRVLEIGAGIGTVSQGLQPHSRHLFLAEPHHRSFTQLSERFHTHDDVTLLKADLSDLKTINGLDAVVMVNVLEHIDSDGDATAQIRTMLNTGGRLILFVPAFPVLYSRFDAEIGHFRRYRKKSLLNVLPADQWKVETLHYVNAPGFVLWWAGMRLLRMSPAESRFTGIFDRHVVPTLRRLESRWRPPFGQSLFLVASRL